MDLENKLCYGLIGGLMFDFAHCCVCSGFLVFGIHETYSTKSLNQVEEVLVHPKNSIEVLWKWGCSDTEVSKLFVGRPSLRKASITWFLS